MRALMLVAGLTMVKSNFEADKLRKSPIVPPERHQCASRRLGIMDLRSIGKEFARR